MNRSKKISFYLIAISLPFLILIVVELAFRITGFFRQQPLFQEISSEGRSWYQVNSQVASRYFNAREMAVPKLYPEKLYREKPDNVIRIFCLGGSTTAGFPFEAQVPFPFQLKKMLQAVDPGHEYEIINLGLSAVNSFTVLDLMPEVLEMQPDLLVIYMGHNEFYGAYGGASAISIGRNGALVRFFLKIQKWHIVQALKKFVSVFSVNTKELLKDETLMEKVIGDKSIPYTSTTYQLTLDNFRDNMTEVIDLADGSGIPLFLGNLVSNVRDMAPMASLMENNRHSSDPDSMQLSQEIKDDENNALRHFQMGKLLLKLDKPRQAALSFYKAKDYDPLRFRASEDLNQIIQEACTGQNVFFVNVKKMIEDNSDHGIPGNDLFCDHLHPNPDGYRLMAASFAREIIPHLGIPSFPDSSGRVHITALDWEIGFIKLYRLLQRWPFADKEVDYTTYKPYGDKWTRDIAYHYVFKNHNWPQSHYDLAEIYLEQDMTPAARNQFLAVSDFYPGRADPFHRIARTFMREGQWQQAERLLQTALDKTAEKGQIYRDLSEAQWQQGKIRETLESIQHAIVAPEFSNKQKAEAAMQLAAYLVSGRRYDDARRVLLDALRFEPGFTPAKTLLESLK